MLHTNHLISAISVPNTAVSIRFPYDYLNWILWQYNTKINVTLISQVSVLQFSEAEYTLSWDRHFQTPESHSSALCL